MKRRFAGVHFARVIRAVASGRTGVSGGAIEQVGTCCSGYEYRSA